MSFGFITEKRLESHNGKIYQQRITRTNIPEQITGLIDGDLDQYWYKFRGKLDADGTLIFSITPENIVKKTIEKRELENGII